MDRIVSFMSFMLDSLNVTADNDNQIVWKELFKMRKKKKAKGTEGLYRQGDVLLVRVEKFPELAKKLPSATVALGEATGHHHTFERGATLMGLDDQVWVVATEPAPLVHQEHSTILVEPGIYKVRVQREYEPEEGQRRVLD